MFIKTHALIKINIFCMKKISKILSCTVKYSYLLMAMSTLCVVYIVNNRQIFLNIADLYLIEAFLAIGYVIQYAITLTSMTHARRVIATARSDAEQSGVMIQQAVEAMAKIQLALPRIGQISAAINEIAFQTSLLALNAGVEAARAGETGRSFAVVASEIRILTQRSAEAANDIKAIAFASTSQIDRGLRLVSETRKMLDHIVMQIHQFDPVVNETAITTPKPLAEHAGSVTAVNPIDYVIRHNTVAFKKATITNDVSTQDTAILSSPTTASQTKRFDVGRDSVVIPMRSARSKPGDHRTACSAMKLDGRSGAVALLKPELADTHQSLQDF